MEDLRNAYRILVGKTEWKRPLGNFRPGLEAGIRMVIRKIWWEGVDWMHLDQDREKWRNFVTTVMNLRV
jgi:hypothetical protein